MSLFESSTASPNVLLCSFTFNIRFIFKRLFKRKNNGNLILRNMKVIELSET